MVRLYCFSFFKLSFSSGTEGRSPLQILKKTNSPRDQRAQVFVAVIYPHISAHESNICVFTCPKTQEIHVLISSQMKLKTSTPDKQRAGQMDRRVLAVCLDKENR